MEGRRELVEFVRKHGIDHDICGKIIVATDPSELDHLEVIYKRGLANGVEDMEQIDGDQIKEIEPYCAGIAGLRVGCTGIVDFRATTEKLAELMLTLNPNSKILLNHEVKSVSRA